MMSDIEFSSDEKKALTAKLQDYFRDELDQDLRGFDAEFLLDFISKEIGGFYYNRGLYDAQAVFSSKLDNITDAIYEIEKPMKF
jgi:uncharacterized protein (DUF2164 family)